MHGSQYPGLYLCKLSQGIVSLALGLVGLTSKGYNFFIKQDLSVVIFGIGL